MLTTTTADWQARWLRARLALANLSTCTDAARNDPRWLPAVSHALAAQLQLLAELRAVASQSIATLAAHA